MCTRLCIEGLELHLTLIFMYFQPVFLPLLMSRTRNDSMDWRRGAAWVLPLAMAALLPTREPKLFDKIITLYQIFLVSLHTLKQRQRRLRTSSFFVERRLGNKWRGKDGN